MFDEPKNSSVSGGAEPPDNLPTSEDNQTPLQIPAKEPEDILASVDPAKQKDYETSSFNSLPSSPTNSFPGARPTKTADLPRRDSMNTQNMPPLLEDEEPGNRKFLTIAIVILVIIILILAGWWAYGRWFKNSGGEIIENQNTAVTNTNTTSTNTNQSTNVRVNTNVNPNTNINTNINTSSPVGEDFDHDGLSDEEERSFGTDPRDIDSDDDGLFDREEVKVYKTNPLDSDSDNDGFLDGEEVKNGYNPKGSGKLLEVPTQ